MALQQAPEMKLDYKIRMSKHLFLPAYIHFASALISSPWRSILFICANAFMASWVSEQSPNMVLEYKN